MRDAETNTGGILSAGRKVEKKEKRESRPTTLADVTGRMKYGVSLIDGLPLRPHLRELLLNHITHQLYKEGKTITVPRGSTTRELSTRRMLAERSLLEAGDINKPDTSQRAMEALWASYDEGERRRRGMKRDRAVGYTTPIDEAVAELTRTLYTLNRPKAALPAEVDEDRLDRSYFVTDWSYLN